jgi:hypothetical protein
LLDSEEPELAPDQLPQRFRKILTTVHADIFGGSARSRSGAQDPCGKLSRRLTSCELAADDGS